MVLYRLRRFLSGDDSSPSPLLPDDYQPIDFELISGVSKKRQTGLGFTVAAKVITGDIACNARIKAHIQYKLPYVDLDEQLQAAHDREIRDLVQACRDEYDNIVEVLVEEWNPSWELAVGIQIYGKPDVRILLSSGRIIIGDAKTGAQHNWHRYQNKIALYAACNSSETSSYRPESIVLKYSSDDQLYIESCRTIDEVLATQELDHLRTTCRDALRNSFPSFAPSTECRYCPFKLGCRAGVDYEQSIYASPIEVPGDNLEASDQLPQATPELALDSPEDSGVTCSLEPNTCDFDQVDSAVSEVSQALVLINQSIDELQGFSTLLANEHKGLFLNTLSLLIQAVSGLESIITTVPTPDFLRSDANIPSDPDLTTPNGKHPSPSDEATDYSEDNQYLIDQLRDIVDDNTWLSLKVERLLVTQRVFLQNDNALRAQISDLNSLQRLRSDYCTKFLEAFDVINASIDGLRNSCPDYDSILSSRFCVAEEPSGPGTDPLSKFLSILGHTQSQFEDARVFCSRTLSRSGLISRLRSSSVIVMRDYSHGQDLPRRVDVQCRHGLDAIEMDYFSDDFLAYIFIVENIRDRFIALWRLLADRHECTWLPEITDENLVNYNQHLLSFVWDPLEDIHSCFAGQSPVVFVSRVLDL